MKLVGTMVVGPLEGEKYLKRCLGAMKKQVDEILIVQNNTDPKTAQVIKDMGCLTYRDDREWGKAQNKIKETLMIALRQLEPDWVLFLDADEELLMTRREIEELCSHPYDVAFFFWCLELWDNENTFRDDLVFETVRLFKFDPEHYRFIDQPLHCGNAPEYNASNATHSAYTFKHYGLMKRADRDRRYKRYQKYDPGGHWLTQSWYDGLIAPSPQLEVISNWPFDPLETHFKKRPIMAKRNKTSKDTIWRLLNKHGVPYETEIEHVMHANVRRGDKLLGEYERGALYGDTAVQPPPVIEDANECNICGKIYKSAAGVKTHQRRMHG